MWGPLVAEPGRQDVVRLSPPGWGAPVPDGWGATVEEYRSWLVGESEAIGEPVDLVGHDGLYRDAAQPAMARLGAHLPAAAARPGLAVLATEDRNVGTDGMRRRAAARAGARVAVLDGLGHWWMVQDPTRAAGVLDGFWSSASR